MQGASKRVVSGVERGWSNGLLEVNGKRPNSLGYFLSHFRGMASAKDPCKKDEEQERKGLSCRRPDLRKKPIAPYKYGYCREPDVPMLMSCPPKGKKAMKGPCCHDEGEKKKGGCKTNK